MGRRGLHAGELVDHVPGRGKWVLGLDHDPNVRIRSLVQDGGAQQEGNVDNSDFFEAL